MCIICVKPQGAKLPDDATIRSMFNHNPHGAGFMFAANGKVHIRKGYMTYDGFRQALTRACEQGADTGALVMHFRITTHGGTCPSNTHPFPLTDNFNELRSLDTTADIGVAHNGIIQIKPRDNTVSDTMEFIASVLTPVSKANPRFYEDSRIRSGIQDCISGSRIVFLTGKGETFMIGNFIESDGCYYSNDSFRPFDQRWLSWYDKWDYDDEKDMPPYSSKKSKKKHGKKAKKQHTQADEHVRKSVRLPWEENARLYVNLMPLSQYETVVSEDGTEYYGIYHAIDAQRRVYFIDPDEGTAMETFDTVLQDIRFDRNNAELFELID